MAMGAKEKAGLLIAVHVAALGVSFLLTFALTPAAQFLLAALVVAQVGLLNTWLVFGPGDLGARMAIWGIVLFLLSLPFMCAPLFASVVHIAALGVLRWKVAGVYFFIGDEEAAASRRLQFSIGRVMAATVAVSVVLAGARFFRTFEPNHSAAGELLGVFAVVAILSLVALSHAFALWAVLGTEHPRIGLAGAIAVSAALGVVLAFATKSTGEVTLYLASIAAAQAAIYSASLLVLRSESYRLFRHPPIAVHLEPPRTDGGITFLEPPEQEGDSGTSKGNRDIM